MEDFIVIEDEKREVYVVAFSVNSEGICETNSEEKALLIADALNAYFQTP